MDPPHCDPLASLGGGRNIDDKSRWLGLLSRRFPFGYRFLDGNGFSKDLNQSILCVPDSIDFESTIAFVSSRLTRDLENQKSWFHFLRSGILRARQDGLSILTCAKTTCDRFLRRAADLFAAQVVPIEIHRINSIDGCGDSLEQILPDEKTIHVFTIASNVDPDELTICLAAKVYAVGLSRKGKSADRLSKALANEKESLVYVANHLSLVPVDVQNQLIQRGAVRWHLYHGHELDPCTTNLSLPEAPKPVNCVPLSVFSGTHDESRFLYHCTRSRIGPWPGQTEEEFLNRLLLSSATQRTPLDCLLRIAHERKLVASSWLNRSRSAVVCFSACKLSEIKNMRVFRPHLSRWDFEPFGLGINRQFLEDTYGAKPVIYGDNRRYRELAAKDKAYFQYAMSITDRGNVTDWTKEQEWRVLGDIELNTTGQTNSAVGQVFFFVPSFREAVQLRAIIRCPIVVLNE